MNLRLIREPSKDGCTLGVLFVDGAFECFTLEDVIREPQGSPIVSTWKVAGDTAIPQGRYRIVRTKSPRFGKVLPLLENVPGFEGIRIHSANRSSETEGCLIPGRVRGHGMVMESRIAFEALDQKIRHAVSDVWITIENP
jgi:hypothetical protein